MSEERQSGSGNHLDAEPNAQEDPVARFFAAGRSAVRDAGSSQLGWQRIVRESRRNLRRRNRMVILSAAAVAVLAIFASWTWLQQPLRDSGPQQGQAITGDRGAVRNDPSAAAQAVSGRQQPFGVPESFTTWSVSNAGHGTLYALGSRSCSGGVCPVLLRSGTNGTSWTGVHTFSGTDVSSATGTDVAQIQPDRAITQTRFATATTGYVFGSDLWITRDSGASFVKLAHPGTTVLDVEIYNGQVITLTADDCAQGVCKGSLYLSRDEAGASSVADPVASMSLTTPISSGDVVVQDGQVFLQTASASSGQPLAPKRLSGSKLVTLAAPTVCGDTPLQALTPATNSTSKLQLYALCAPRDRGSATSYAVVRSDDAGAHWSSVSVGSLTLPRLGQVWLAVADDQHLVASAGGPRDTDGVPASSGKGSLMVSTNGGLGWAAARTPSNDTVPTTGFDWTASAGAGYFYAVPRTTGSFWATSDYGLTWRKLNPPG